MRVIVAVRDKRPIPAPTYTAEDGYSFEIDDVSVYVENPEEMEWSIPILDTELIFAEHPHL